jgi:hypothetical protein
MMRNTNAFPVEINEHTDTGMTLRDYFATAAMSGFLSTDYFRGKPFNLVAEDAYRVADAMLNERENYDY